LPDRECVSSIRFQFRRVAAALMSHGRLPQYAIGRPFDLKLRAPSERRRET
jgi:hypothetical protein